MQTLQIKDVIEVDRVIGKKKPSIKAQKEIDWSECPLAKAYPNWDLFLEQLADERSQKTRPPHPRAVAPFSGKCDEMEGGMSPGQVKRRYK